MRKWKTRPLINQITLYSIYDVTSASTEQFYVFSPAPVAHLMGTVEHPHQRLLVIDARERYDNRRIGDDQIQVALGEVKVDRLKSKFQCSQWP